MAHVRRATGTAPASTASAGAPEGLDPKEDFVGAMLEPSVVNKSWVRAVVLLLSVGVAAGSTVLLPVRLLSFVHVISYATMLGSTVWNTFFVGLTMFKNMPRQTFGKVQSKLFPQYFALTTACNVLLLGSWLVASGDAVATATQPSAVVISLAVSLASSLLNWFYLEPVCTRLMFERYDLENKGDAKTDADKERIKVLYKEFGKMHGISALVNLVILACLVGHGWVLAAHMVLALS